MLTSETDVCNSCGAKYVRGVLVGHVGARRARARRNAKLKKRLEHVCTLGRDGLFCHFESVQPGDVLLQIARREERETTREEAERLLAESYGPRRMAQVEVYGAHPIRTGEKKPITVGWRLKVRRKRGSRPAAQEGSSTHEGIPREAAPENAAGT